MRNRRVFAARLQHALEMRGVTQYRLAMDLGCSQMTIHYLRNPNDTTQTNIDLIENIAERLDVNPCWLLGYCDTCGWVGKTCDIIE